MLMLNRKLTTVDTLPNHAWTMKHQLSSKPYGTNKISTRLPTSSTKFGRARNSNFFKALPFAGLCSTDRISNRGMGWVSLKRNALNLTQVVGQSKIIGAFMVFISMPLFHLVQGPTRKPDQATSVGISSRGTDAGRVRRLNLRCVRMLRASSNTFAFADTLRYLHRNQTAFQVDDRILRRINQRYSAILEPVQTIAERCG
jgi:hypothetical protein